MNTVIKKHNISEWALEEYMNNITAKCEVRMPAVKKVTKISDDKVVIPTTETYTDIVKYNYNLAQLKSFAKHYKLKLSGNKGQLMIRVYSFLYFSSHIVKIQKRHRGNLVRKYKTLRGPAYIDRNICTNSTDFVTLEPLKEIPFSQFFSYKDDDGFIYGFDIASLHSLMFVKSTPKEKESQIDGRNPYNRKDIPDAVIHDIKTIIRLGRILSLQINLQVEDDSSGVSVEKAIELRALALFQNIDALGNYTNSKWFLSLNRNQLIRYVRELHDIWNYRAQLTNEMKHNIFPHHGGPFRSLNVQTISAVDINVNNIKKVILEVLENLVNSGIDRDSKSLGAYFVLGALTIVSTDAANALPWLFQSVGHF